MTKIAIFDFDGTLANSFPWFLSRINHVAKILRFKTIQEEDIPQLRLMKVHEMMSFLGVRAWKMPLIVFYMRKLIKEDREQIHLFKEVPSFLRSLKDKGIKIIILSTNSQQNVELILKESKQYIDHYFCGAGVRSKDKQLKKVLKAFPGADLVSIGDEFRDLEAAQKFGVTHFNVSWGFADKNVFKGFEVVESFTELEARILRQFNVKS